MNSEKIQIGRSDIIWNFFAVFFKVTSTILLLPLILKMLPSEDVGIWTLFSAISSLIILLDFGFNSSFSRNLTYIFSGIKELQTFGVSKNIDSGEIDYSLLKGTISAMKWFYFRVSLLLLFVLGIFGTLYLHTILNKYSGDKIYIYIAWCLFCIINTYSLYTLYYDALLQSKGLIKISKRISVISQTVYLIIAFILIYYRFGLIAIIFSQLISVIINRIYSYRIFYTPQLKTELSLVSIYPQKDILKSIYPNAVKIGVTSLGAFMIQKSSIFLGSIFLSLSDIGSFGITKQIADIIIYISGIYISTYIPKISEYRIHRNNDKIKIIYIKGLCVAFLILLLSFGALFVGGNFVYLIVKSKTHFVDNYVLAGLFFSSIVGLNCGISGSVIATKNEIPFFKSSIISGIANITLLFIFFKWTNLGLFGMAIAPGIIDLLYQGWKWPYEVIKDLKISFNDLNFIKILNV